MVLPTAAWAGAPDVASSREINRALMFSMLFLMLGPIKILAPFVALTQGADAALKRRLATRASLFAAAAVAIAAGLGRRFLENLGVPLPVLGLTGGLILFLVALQQVQAQYATRPHGVPSEPPSLQLAFTPLAFPTIVTPYGIAAVILFVVIAPDFAMALQIFSLVLLVLAINWLAMMFAETVLSTLGGALQLFGVVLGVVQVALGLDVMLRQLHVLGVIALQVP